jgi:hypothetical protein
VSNLLKRTSEVLPVDNQRMRHIPGHKFVVTNLDWPAESLLHSLLKPSSIELGSQRVLLHDLNRSSLVEERARMLNGAQQILEEPNVKLSSVVMDIGGVSVKTMLERIAARQTDQALVADSTHRDTRVMIPEPEKALMGLVDSHHRFLFSE